MTPENKLVVEQAFDKLTAIASNHQGCSSGEWASWQLLEVLTDKPCARFLDSFARVDSDVQGAFLTILTAVARGIIHESHAKDYIDEARSRRRAKRSNP